MGIGIGSARLSFPPLSMDLTPMDFSFWHYVKGLLSTHNPSSTKELEAVIHIVKKSLSPEIITSMCQGVKRRCQMCLTNNGGRFEGGVEY